MKSIMESRIGVIFSLRNLPSKPLFKERFLKKHRKKPMKIFESIFEKEKSRQSELKVGQRKTKEGTDAEVLSYTASLHSLKRVLNIALKPF